MSEPITATWNGRPLEDLSKALTLMERYMGYTAESAVTAMSINVLKGIRSRTRVAKLPGSHKEKQTGRFRPGYRTLPGGKRQRTIRDGGGKGHHIDNWRSTHAAHALDSNQWLTAGVFAASFPQRQDLKSYHLVGIGNDDARDYVLRRHPITKHKGLAKHALGVAMAKVSASAAPHDGMKIEKRAAALASSLVSVTRNKNVISIKDNLNYAQNAVRGGAAAIDKAQQAAVNKVLGWFHHRFHNLWDAACAGAATPSEQLDALTREMDTNYS